MMGSILLLAMSLGGSEAVAAGTKQNEYVRVEVSFAQHTLHPGANGELLVTFKPVDGIHINADPPVRVGVSPSTIIRLHGEQSQAVDSSTGYLFDDEPVSRPFKISSKASPGTHILRADVTYYFCSDEEGWCRKFVQTLELPLILSDANPASSRKGK